MAACTRASATGDHLLRVVSEVAQHHNRGAAAGHAGDGPAHARRAAGLVEPGDRHPVRGPPGHRAVLPAERVAAIAAVERALDHVLVRALDVRGALHERSEDVLVTERGHVAADVLELPAEDRLLVLV